MEKIHFNSISEANKYFNYPEPENPLFHINAITGVSNQECQNIKVELSYSCYTILFKKIIKGDIHYGKTKYDCNKGVMLFTAPDQVMSINGIVVSGDAYQISIHDDYIKGTQLRERIKKYNFFSYSTNEALHLSPREEKQITSIIKNIEQEYHNNTDEFSKEIILSQLDTLLKYANRYYKRQFIDRKDISTDTYKDFKNILDKYFENNQHKLDGIPTVEYLANELNVSPRYLSDLLKVETGISAIKHIHLYLVEEAKNLLYEPKLTVSEIAYQLGFDYPQYFSRLFKNKVGKSPKQYREEVISTQLSSN